MRKEELKKSEYTEFYATYLKAIGNVDLKEELEHGKNWMIAFLSNLEETKLNFAYGKEKWTIAQVIMHIIDTERVFQYRAFCFSRKDNTSLPGFNQDDYVKYTNMTERNLENILEEYVSVREASISLFKNLSTNVLRYEGTASNITWSVGGLGFVISGHQKHHCNILQQRYF